MTDHTGQNQPSSPGENGSGRRDSAATGPGINRSFTCAGCGFTHAGVPAAHLAPAIKEVGRQWQEKLSTVSDHPGGLDALATLSPTAGWSAVEHGCYTRDMVALATRRIELAVLAHHPPFTPWDAQGEAELGAYRQQHPLAVADDIETNCARLAQTWQRLGPGEFARAGTLSGEVLRVADLGQRALHDARHHLVLAQAVIPAPATT